MGEIDSLWIILGAIYLAECLVWIPRNYIALGAWMPGAFRFWHSETFLANAQGGFGACNPLPPLGSMLLSAPLPFSVSPQAAYSWSASALQPGAGRPSQTGRLAPFDQIRSVEVDGRRVLVNGALWLKARTPRMARRAARIVEEIRTLSEPDRAKAIQSWVKAGFDSDGVRERLAAGRRWEKRIRPLANLLAVYLFVGAPWVCHAWGFRRAALGLAAGLFVQTITLALLYRRAHTDLYPKGAEERFAPFWTMTLAAPSAIRAWDALSLPLLEGYHPLAVARELAGPALFRELAERTLRDLHTPLLPACASADPLAVETERWFRAVMTETAESFVARAGLKPEELLAAPAPREAVNRTYCPRCAAQFMIERGVCRDCGGRELERLAPGGV